MSRSQLASRFTFWNWPARYYWECDTSGASLCPSIEVWQVRAQMSIGADAAVIVAERRGEMPVQVDGATHLIRVRVDDVAAQFERARAHGARVLEPPTDREYGERDCALEDVAGHRWQFAQTVRDVAPEDFGCKTIAPWPGR